MKRKIPIIHILIVEDDEDDYVLTSRLLRQAESFEFVVDWVADPTLAREVFREDRHDICLMDYRLGAEVSINLVREALSLGFTAPIIMLTGQDDAGVEIAAAAAGAVDYLVKDNLGREQLLRSIRYALARSEILAERFERVRAETANRSKTEFLAILSHEIRTPLTAIIGYTELLIHQHQQTNADLAHKLQIINRNGTHLLSLLNDTLDLSKIEAGKLEIDIDRIELGPFVLNAVSLIKEMAEAKHLTLQISARTLLPRFIQSDAMRLRQILFNLLGNAIKFTEEGTVELQLKMDNNFLEFHVLDTGKGISRTDLDKIFAPFTQVARGQSEGTGLGLTISQKLAEKLGGAISAHSIEGGGSRFIIRIDPGTVSFDELASLDPLPVSMPVPLRPGKLLSGSVLVVDDVEDIRELISNILAAAEIKTVTASNGRTALASLEELGSSGIAAVLMDLNMPVLDGYETLRIMRDRGYNMPVIALTAASLKGEREKCLRAGFSAYLPKPVTAATLLAEIERQVQNSYAQTNQRVANGSERILVIEDNTDANAAICMLLQLMGHDVTGAHNQREAIDFFEQTQPTIVLADIHLGDSDGLALLQQFSARASDVRYFVLSGDRADIADELPPYIEGFITKPVTLGMLSSVLGAAKTGE
ncbi:MAG: response regulator [Pseudomonadota bacterium]